MTRTLATAARMIAVMWVAWAVSSPVLAEPAITPDRVVANPQVVVGGLTLAQCVELALQNNPNLAAGQWDVQTAEARRDVAGAGRWPTFSFEGGYQNYNDPQRLIAARFNGEAGVFDTTLLRNDLVVRYPLYTGGRISSELAGAEALVQAEAGHLARTREELSYNVTRTVYGLLAQDRVLASLDFSRRALGEQKKRIQSLLEVQKAAKVDLLRIEVRLADLEQTRLREYNNLAILKRQLTNLIGVDLPSDRLGVAETLSVGEMPTPGADLYEQALAQRPDYHAAKARLEAQRQRIVGARAARLPAVNLVGSVGERRLGTGEHDNTRVIGLTVSMLLLDGGRVNARTREEVTALEAQRERLRSLEQLIRLEVESALLDLQASRARIAALEKSMEQGAESLRIERLKYDLGKGSITDVLDAQAALLLVETTHARAIADALIAGARLNFATGEQP